MEQDEPARLPGRDQLLAELSAAIGRGRPPAVVVVELRDHGALRADDPEAADAALRTVAERLRRLVRASDLLARTGDGTFVIAGGGVHEGTVQVLVDRILGAVAFPYESGDRVLSLVADVGWATGAELTSADALVAAAEADLAERRA